MQKLVYFDYAALVIFLIVFLSLLLRRSLKGYASRMFFAVVSVMLLTTVFDTGSVLLGNFGRDGHLLGDICHTGYLLCHTLSAAVYASYLLAITDSRHKLMAQKEHLFLYYLPAILFALFALTNPFHRYLFYFDADGTYVRGALFVVCYLISVFYLIYGLVVFWRYRHFFAPGDIVVILAIYPLMGVAMAVQFVAPTMVIEMFANSAGVMMVWASIQRTEILLDSQTSFGNQSACVSACRKALANEKPMRLIRVQVNHYDYITDGYGLVGEEKFLTEVSDRIRTADRESGTDARVFYLGNGVFHLAVEEARFPRVEDCARRLVNNLTFVFVNNGVESEIHSYVCVFRLPEDIVSVETLGSLNNLFNDTAGIATDTLLYAEDLFKNPRYRLATDLSRVIENALQQDRFELYYQPIWSIEEERYVSAEALLRLNDPEYGFIPPDRLIQAAEQNGTIYAISDMVLRKVCTLLASEEFRDMGTKYIECNLSAMDCRRKDLPERVLTIARSCGADPANLNLEITETAACTTDNILDSLYKLKEYGFGLSLDDFGSGYSNLGRLLGMPVDILKMDRDFAAVDTNESMARLTAGMLPLLGTLVPHILIEGVENELQAQHFIDHHCHYVQGYYYARPMPETEFIRFMKEQNSAD